LYIIYVAEMIENFSLVCDPAVVLLCDV